MKQNLAAACLLILASAVSQTTSKGFYPSLPLPGAEPLLFGPGLVSDGLSNRDFTISPAGDECFFTLQQRDLVSVIMTMKKRRGKWSEPEVASFSGMFNDLEASFRPNGNTIFFSSNRPLDPSDSTGDYNIWYTDKTFGAWGTPVPLGAPVNTEKDEFYPSVTKTGNLYFTTQLESGMGKEDIVVCEWRDGKYRPPVSLPGAVNSPGYEFNAFVDADEQFIIFTAYGRSDDMGRGDLYLSRNQNGQWEPAFSLGPSVNSASLDYCPFVSQDGKYLFFTSSRAIYKAPFTERQTTRRLRAGLSAPGNGLDDVYWVSFDAINPGSGRPKKEP